MPDDPSLRPNDSALAKEYLGRAAEIAPRLRETRSHGERHGYMAEETFVLLHEAGFLDFFKPRSLGGVEADLSTYLDVASELSRHDTTAGWMMMVSDAWWLMRTAEDRWVEEFADDRKTFFATSFNKPLHAEEVEGGYVLSGACPFMSGCRHADWVGVAGLVHREGKPLLDEGLPVMLAMQMPVAELEILDDWDTLGMRGTSSNTIRADEVMVPRHRAFRPQSDRGLGKHYQGTLYRCAMASLHMTMPAVSLGATRLALDTLSDIAQDKVPFQSTRKLKTKQLAQVHYGRALAYYRAAYSYLRNAMEISWDRALTGRKSSLLEKADLSLAATYALETCANATREIATAAATSSIYKECPIEHAIRDVEVLRHHGFAPEGRYGTVAQCYWGVEPDTPMVAMD